MTNLIAKTSNIEKQLINLPKNITIKLLENSNSKLLRINNQIDFKQIILPKSLNIEIINNKLKIREPNMGGTIRTLINNIITGLNKSYIYSYNLKGVGAKAIINQNNLQLHLGYSRPIDIIIPLGIELKNRGVNVIVGKSNSKLLLSQFINKIKLLNKRK